MASPRPLPPTPAPEWNYVAEHIKLLHVEGLPFFNHSMLQRVALQIRLYEAGMLNNKPFLLENVKGDIVSIMAEPEVESPIWIDRRCNHGDRKKGPYIYYRTVQCMTSHRDMKQYDPDQAYLPLVVMFPSAPGHCHGHHRHENKHSNPDSTFYSTELQHILQVDRASWEQSFEYAHLKGQLKAHHQRLSKIDNIVAFALGSLATGRTRCQHSTTQHAFVLSLQKILSKMHPENNKVRQTFRNLKKKDSVNLVVNCVLQDPSYTDVDETVLQSEGMKILGDPNGFLQVNENSLVVSIAPNTPVQQIVENLARPAAIIWETYVQELNGENVECWTDPSSIRVNKMLREQYDIVQLKQHQYLRNIVLYIKKAGLD
ncbi:hypothetical protein F4781DRAFT_429861 [Annulohypoxylon bovei var. microspora]|nr:hypothetical protein F4781DRAFT_429861 [Annulohypoxylon bovei var. microspora]